MYIMREIVKEKDKESEREMERKIERPPYSTGGGSVLSSAAQGPSAAHLAALRVPWRRSECTTRAVVPDLLLEVPRTRTASYQKAFTCATGVVCNIFTVNMDVEHMSTHQVKSAAHTWLQTYPPRQ